MATFWCHEASSILSTQNYGVTCKPHCYLGLSAWYMGTDTHFCMLWMGGWINPYENIMHPCAYFRCPGFVYPWFGDYSTLIILFLLSVF